MNIFLVVLDFYFAALLGTSGAAKIRYTEEFRRTLQEQRLLPAWAVPLVQYGFPWLEVCLAIALVVGAVQTKAAVLLAIIFVAFLLLKLLLFKLRPGVACGCHGPADDQGVNVSTIVSATLVSALSIIHLVLASSINPPSISSRLICGAVFASIVAVLLVLQQRRQKARMLKFTASQLRQGDKLPIDIKAVLPTRAFLTVVSPHCKPCKDLCAQLADINLGEWSLVFLILDIDQNQDNELTIPPHAQRIYDPDRTIADALGVIATPLTLVLADGKFVEQAAGGMLSWFVDKDRYRRVKAVLHEAS